MKRPSFYHAPDKATGGKSDVHVSEDTKEFMGKFAPPAGMLPIKGDPVEKEGEVREKEPVVNKEEVEKRTKEASDRMTQRKEEDESRAKQDKTPGEKQGFVKKTIEEKRKAEEEKQAALDELKTFKEVEVPKLNTQIAELQKKIDSGELSSTREKEFTSRIAALEKEKEEGTKSLSDELQATRSKLALYDLREDPQFVSTYVRPMAIAMNKLTSLVDQDAQRSQILEQALLANQHAITANNAHVRKVAEQQRDEMIDNILDGWPETTKRRFSVIFEDFINTSEQQAVALSRHQETTQELRRRGVVNQQEEAKQILRVWHAEYDSTEKEFKEDLELPKEVKDRLKDIKYIYDPEEVQNEIETVLSGKADIPQAVRVLRYGQAYHAVKAKNAALQAEVEALRETVSKLKGTNGSSGNQNRYTQQQEPKEGSKTAEGEVVNASGKTRSEWQKKFSPAHRE